jgi:hypothetical protein
VIGALLSAAIAAGRVVERRVRTSPTLTRRARVAMALVARLSRNGRAFVRLRLMPIV